MMVELKGIPGNTDVLLSLQGLAFFTLGVIVLMHPGRENIPRLERCMWLLGLFGILQAVSAWAVPVEDLAARDSSDHPLHPLLQGASFLCLFEFARRVLGIALSDRPGFHRAAGWTRVSRAYLLPALGAGGWLAGPGPLAGGFGMLPAYALALPGAIAGGLGFLILARTVTGQTGAPGRSAFAGMGYVFLTCALLITFGPPAPSFAAEAIVAGGFGAETALQASRSALAWVAVLAVGNLLRVFHQIAASELNSARCDADRLRQRSELVLETTDDAICGVDRDGRITFANPAAGRLLGSPPERLLGRPFGDFRVPHADDDAQEPKLPDFPCPKPHRSEKEYFARADGSRFPVEYSSTPRYDSGRLSCAVIAFRDITLRRDSERAERWEQRQRFRAVFEQAAAGIALMEMDGVCLQVNDRLCRILGRPAEALLDTPFEQFVHEQERADCGAAKRGIMRGEPTASNVVEARCWRGDGEVVWVQFALSLVRNRSAAPLYFVLVVDDITERKEAETALLRSQADLERSQRIARLGSWELNLQDRAMNWSKEALRIIGLPESAAGLDEFLEAAHPGDYDEVAAAVQGWFEGRGRRNLEYRIVRPDGFEHYVDLSVRFEYGPEGAPVRAVGTIQDIDERKRTEQVLEFYRNRLELLVEERTAELRASNRDLASANRELEAFSYSVSHDLRSPLRAINGFTQALREDYGERLDGEALNYIGKVQNATVRMGELIDGLLNLSRVFRSEFDAEPVDLSALAREISRQLRAAYPERPVELEIEPELTAMGDPTLLRLLLQNLIGNAWKFTAEKSEPAIVFGRDAAQGETPFYVRDNGVGFEMEYAHQLFQPFQRLHAQDEYDGTGIGLATVRRIVQRHGGHVWAEGEPGFGATIYFTLEPGTAERHGLELPPAVPAPGG